jgi:hypothetical protein
MPKASVHETKRTHDRASDVTSTSYAWMGVRLAFTGEHIRDCPYVALWGFFCISDAQAVALRVENARLRARLDSVEGMLADESP